MSNPVIITLLSDFGGADHYVAAMKGVILGKAPHVQLVDVTHDIPPQNIVAGAFVLSNIVPWFPVNTIHVAVVDPGVGSSRRMIAGRWCHQTVLAPDNGLVSFLQQDDPTGELYEFSTNQPNNDHISSTFHGRDVIAPVAAALAEGAALSSVGAPLERPLTLHIPEPTKHPDGISGEVLYVDHFGKLITNIRESSLIECRNYDVEINNHSLCGPKRCYADAGIEQPLALIGSNHLLEIAVNQGSAASALGAGIGSAVDVRFRV